MSTIHDFKVDDWLRRLLPGRCAFCLAACESTAPWCQACHLALPWNLPACPACAEPQPAGSRARRCGRCLQRAPAFDTARVPLRYEGELRGLMQGFKFQASPRAGSLMLALLEDALRDKPCPQALLAVPLHPRRARQRGFDQARWLAERLSARLDIPLVVAQRRRDTPSQRGLDRKRRRGNLRAAFRVETALPPEVALLDDVMTTGATLDALARACHQAGAERVEAWAVARTPLP
ncbi:ComF family protein [Halomonas elongata]|uniref:ComF family protein n=1 Tax=Halomonas elongata (strain ATCC 33173 / DSM 2581 / NBRC 15536 / NCIMB 2198 / 1H9) TaxID=768066 RepID=E1VAK9_HALED|nr:ComF family protein [Halomonas elongata]WBF19328.1 ComF family protein [Halomonas elongata]WPU48188.1 ComF family protein [Halomonas elongata DSM 2581]CBV42055.2 ComF family protein [Halomonas elongata DSM 2581]